MNFPIGYYNFHRDRAINFQMNRWYSFGCVGYDALMESGKQIQNFDDWSNVFCSLAEQAKLQNDLKAWATYLRAAQFYTLGDETDENGKLQKISLYERCFDAYEVAYSNIGMSYIRIPFETGYIPVLYKKHKKQSKGTILIHGGYDSFIQEFVPMLCYIYENGYDVYLFEGYGQGEVCNRCNIKMQPQWEKCTTPVLDYFGFTNVTLIGISLGGYFAARAAAFDDRIKRVVLYDIVYDYCGALLSNLPLVERSLLNLLLRFPKSPLWKPIERKMCKNAFVNWIFRQGCHIFENVHTLPEFFIATKAYNTREISPLIKQDVLLLAGEDDMYTIYFEKQRKALTSAKTVTGRIFTRAETASQHCQVGNIKLLLDYILNWIETVD